MPEALVVAAARGPIGRASKGALARERADDMAAQMLSAAMSQVPALAWERVDDLLLGVAHQTGEQAQNMARRVAVLAGHDGLPGTTVSRACASSMQTTLSAAAAIRAGYGSAYVSAGVEAVSRYAKMAGPEDRNPLVAGDEELPGASWIDPRSRGALPNVYVDMGMTAENVAATRGVSRAAQDAYALESQRRYAAAEAAGFWAAEITPLTRADGTVVDRDDSPRPTTTTEGLESLKPVFLPDGTVTAGNACPLNDGAAALVVTSDDLAAELGLVPRARIVSFGLSGVSPEIMGLGPIEASRAALRAARMEPSDVDVMEINEAFAAQVIPCVDELGIPDDHVNPHGGAIALGHPFGMTGVRMTATLLNDLAWRDGTVGLQTLCVGGGMGMAMVVERLS
jgi:acetyl-CoA C-acetyltransferase